MLSRTSQLAKLPKARLVAGSRRAVLRVNRYDPALLCRSLGSQTPSQTDRVSALVRCLVEVASGSDSFFFIPFFSQETITRLLYSIGTKREVERYLRIFSSSSHPSQPAKFAVIKIGGAVFDQLDELALSLSFLYRVGLYPVILHGAGPQLNEIIEAEGVVPDYSDGIRITGDWMAFFVRFKN